MSNTFDQYNSDGAYYGGAPAGYDMGVAEDFPQAP